MPQPKADLVAVPLWDPWVRLFHWLLVAALLFSWLSVEMGWMELHYRSGLVVLGLAIFRVLWGLVGSPAARFAHFLRGPRAAIDYLRRMSERAPSYGFGHNAAGGLMVLAILAVVLLQATTGLFNYDDIVFEGPFYDNVPEAWAKLMGRVHETVFNVILALAALHILVILLYRLWKRENLVRAMITGKASLPAETAARATQSGETRFASPLRALLCAIVAAAVPIAIYTLN